MWTSRKASPAKRCLGSATNGSHPSPTACAATKPIWTSRPSCDRRRGSPSQARTRTRLPSGSLPSQSASRRSGSVHGHGTAPNPRVHQPRYWPIHARADPSRRREAAPRPALGRTPRRRRRGCRSTLTEHLRPAARARTPDNPETKRTLWGLTYQNLPERIAVELFEIFATQPRLHRCRFCNRIFIPRTRTDTKCRADLWSTDQPSPLELCIPQSAVDSHNANVLGGQHERERKRRHQQMRREIKRGGEDSPRAKRAKADYETWISAHGKRRGPAPHPQPDLHKHTGDM